MLQKKYSIQIEYDKSLMNNYLEFWYTAQVHIDIS